MNNNLIKLVVLRVIKKDIGLTDYNLRVLESIQRKKYRQYSGNSLFLDGEYLKRLIMISVMAMIIFTGCSPKEENIVFTAVIDEINDNSLLVTAIDFDGFDCASVGYGEDLEIGFNLITGQKLAITILPEIRESYPVQVTATGIELLEDVKNMNPAYRKITPGKAKEMIDSGNVVILDVRTESEFAEAHIAGAILLPDYDIEALSPKMLTDKGETILVYCRSGRRSEAAAKALIETGYTDVYDFGGIIDWPYETVRGK